MFFFQKLPLIGKGCDDNYIFLASQHSRISHLVKNSTGSRRQECFARTKVHTVFEMFVEECTENLVTLERED